MRYKPFTIPLFLISAIFIGNPSVVSAHGIAEDRLHELSHLIEQDPFNPETYIQRGRIYRDTEQFDLALEDFRAALETDGESHEAWYWKGEVHFLLEQFEAARHAVQLYLSAQPESINGHILLARIHVKTNDLDQAIKHYDQAIRVDDRAPPQIYLERAQALLNHTPLRAKEFVDGLEVAIKQHGPLLTFIQPLVQFHKQRGEYNQALARIDQLPTALTATPQWLLLKAEIYEAMENDKAARDCYLGIIEFINSLPAQRQSNKGYSEAFITAQHKINAPD